MALQPSQTKYQWSGIGNRMTLVVPSVSSAPELPTLADAYESCRRETAHWSKTFYLGTLLMPPQKRRAIWAIYVWCRRTDELMDSPSAKMMPNDQLLQRLNTWEQHTRKLFQGEVKDGLDLVMVDTMQKFPQPLQAYLDMIEGQRMDVQFSRYKTFSDLKLYCYRVAGTVGLMSQAVMGLDAAYTSAPWSLRPDPTESAVALGIANQLTNILRDVGEDSGRGRIYLPQEDLKYFNYSEADLMSGVINDNWRHLMAFQLRRARNWFSKSEQGVRWLSSDARWPVWASLRLYRGILNVIEKNDYDVFNHRAFVTTRQKLIDLPLSYIMSQMY